MLERIILSLLIYLLPFLLLVNVLYLGLVISAARGLGYRPESANLFFGKALFQFRWLQMNFGIGWIPMGASVKFEDEERREMGRGKGAFLEAQSFLPGLFVAVVILGFSQAMEEILSCPVEIFRGAIGPLSTVPQLVEKLFALHESPVNFEIYGILCAKFASLMMLLFLVNALWNPYSRIGETVRTISALALLGVQGAWVIGFAAWLWRGAGGG